MASIITGKTVYVLGAGASYHTGAPLLKDFLVASRSEREKRGSLRYAGDFDDIFEWIDKLRGSSYYVEFDLDNLEHVFSLLDMSRQLDIPGSKELVSKLRHLITETLDRCQLHYRDKQLHPDGLYADFVRRLSQYNEKRESTRGVGYERDVIVTFNYDVMLDYVFHFKRIGMSYCLTSRPRSDDFKLLKLHGSTNWAECATCKNGVVELPAQPIPPGHHIDPFFEDGGQFSFKMIGNVLANTVCSGCKGKGTFESFIIPPTWSKSIGGSPIAPVWKAAVEEIANAFQVVVIGYSMPSTDTFLQYLLTLGLSKSASLNRVIVVNPDERIEESYRSVFSRSLFDRGRLRFEKSRFEEFINTGLLDEYATNA